MGLLRVLNLTKESEEQLQVIGSEKSKGMECQ
jgi:hypothetical protein